MSSLFGVVFISRPIRVEDGRPAAGPSTRFLPHKRFGNLLHLDRSRLILPLENFQILSSTRETLYTRVPNAGTWNERPYGHITFQVGGEKVQQARKELFAPICAQGDGIYLLVGAAVCTKHAYLTTQGDCHSLGGVVEYEIQVMNLKEYDPKKKVCSSALHWLASRLKPVEQHTSLEGKVVVATGVTDGEVDL